MNPNNGSPAFFGVKVSKPGVPVQTAGPTGLIYENDYTSTIYYDNSNSRVLLGQLPDGTYGIWTSQPGVDVVTASPRQLTFNSNAILIVAVSGVYTFTAQTLGGSDNVQLEATIPHDLGYAPGYECFCPNLSPFIGTYDPANLQYVPVGLSTGDLDTADGNFEYVVNSAVDSNNLYLQLSILNTSLSSHTFPAFGVSYFVYTYQV